MASASRGRGRAWFITNDELAIVLRHYQRGGALAKLLGDRYLWRELAQTRAWQEWHLLATLWQEGLPVPQPLAAHVEQAGIFYRADLIMAQIKDSRSLSDVLAQQPLDESAWQAIGRMIQRFHTANVYHADMNAHNILVDDSGATYLIDFDKCKIMQDANSKKSWRESTLQRLQRSLNKLRFEDVGFQYSDKNWSSLMAGYQAG